MFSAITLFPEKMIKIYLITLINFNVRIQKVLFKKYTLLEFLEIIISCND